MTTDTFDALQHKAAGLKPIKAEPDQEHHIRSTMSMCVVKSSFFATLLYSELPVTYTEDIPVAATDGTRCYVSPSNFMTRTLGEGNFILCHEVMHYVRGDCLLMHFWMKEMKVLCPSGKYLPYNGELMNISEDYVINAGLLSNGLEMPDDALYDYNLSEKGMESSLEVYEKLHRQCNGNPNRLTLKGGRHSRPGQGKVLDVKILPSDEQAANDNPQKRIQAIAAAAEVARGQGQLPAQIAMLLGELLNPKVPWQDQMMATMSRRSGEPALDWRYPNKRLIVGTPDPIFYGRPSYFGCGLLGISVDVSGSIYHDPTIVQRFFSEMVGMIEQLNPQRLVIYWCDMRICRTDDLEEPEDLNELWHEINRKGGLPGGGGTSFRPVFEELAKLDDVPDLLVYFTDGEGSFPERAPEYPVVWGMTGDVIPPFGDVVKVEV